MVRPKSSVAMLDVVMANPCAPTLDIADELLAWAQQLSGLAEWVLSACNTAASDGTPGAEGMSRLAKAFF